jgi:CheY-like chemotaxis protein
LPTVVKAHSGQNAIDLVAKGQAEHHIYDKVFMDLSMPLMDGLTAVQKIRKIEGQDEPKTKFIAVSGLSRNQYIELYHRTPSVDFDEFCKHPHFYAHPTSL